MSVNKGMLRLILKKTALSIPSAPSENTAAAWKYICHKRIKGTMRDVESVLFLTWYCPLRTISCTLPSLSTDFQLLSASRSIVGSLWWSQLYRSGREFKRFWCLLRVSNCLTAAAERLNSIPKTKSTICWHQIFTHFMRNIYYLPPGKHNFLFYTETKQNTSELMDAA